MNCSEEDVPDYIKKQSILKDIQALLGPDISEEDENTQPKKFDPYSLDSTVHPHLENKFINGVKKLPKAYKELKPAYKSQFISEIIIMEETADNLIPSEIFNNDVKRVRVYIPQMPGEYYVLTAGLTKLLSQNLHEVKTKQGKNKNFWIACVGFDYDFIKENVRKR